MLLPASRVQRQLPQLMWIRAAVQAASSVLRLQAGDQTIVHFNVTVISISEDRYRTDANYWRLNNHLRNLPGFSQTR